MLDSIYDVKTLPVFTQRYSGHHNVTLLIMLTTSVLSNLLHGYITRRHLIKYIIFLIINMDLSHIVDPDQPASMLTRIFIFQTICIAIKKNVYTVSSLSQ